MAIRVRCPSCGHAFEVADSNRGKTGACPACRQPCLADDGRPANHVVFVSHSHVDVEVARRVCAALEQAGVRCWMAARDMRAGQKWAAAIIEAISQCRVMVLVHSSHANASPQIMREVENALARDIPTIALHLDESRFQSDGAAQAKIRYSLDASPAVLDACIRRLVSQVKLLTGIDLNEEDALAFAEREALAVRWKRKVSQLRTGASGLRLALLAVIAILAAAAIFGAQRTVKQSETEATGGAPLPGPGAVGGITNRESSGPRDAPLPVPSEEIVQSDFVVPGIQRVAVSPTGDRFAIAKWARLNVGDEAKGVGQKGATQIYLYETSSPQVLAIQSEQMGQAAESIAPLAQFEDAVTGIAFSSDGMRLAVIVRTPGRDWSVIVFDIPAVSPGRTFEFGFLSDVVAPVVLSPDCQRAAVHVIVDRNDAMPVISALDADNPSPVALEYAIGPGSGIVPDIVTFSPDGSLLAGIDLGGQLFLWDAATGAIVGRGTLPEGEDPDFVAQFAPDGERLFVLAPGDGRLYEFDLNLELTHTTELEFTNKSERVMGFSPDGTRLAIVLDSVLLMDADTLKVVERYPGGPRRRDRVPSGMTPGEYRSYIMDSRTPAEFGDGRVSFFPNNRSVAWTELDAKLHVLAIGGSK